MGPSLIFIYKSSTAGAPDCFTTPSCVAAARHGGARGVYAKINLAGSFFCLCFCKSDSSNGSAKQSVTLPFLLFPPLSQHFFCLSESPSLKSISSKIGSSSRVMKSLVHLQDDESNLWLPAFQTFGLREGKGRLGYFFLFLKLWVEGKENVLWNKPALRREMSLRSFRRFPSSPPELSWAKIGG